MSVRVLFALLITIFLLAACQQNQAPTETQQNMSDSSMDMGANSSAYLQVTNNTDSDVKLMSASAEGVGMAQIHQTIIENDMARMEPVTDGLLIHAGETLELRPASYHIMLMQLEKPLMEGQSLHMSLEFDNGTSIAFDAPIASENPNDNFSVENDGITVSGAWVRPTMLAEESATTSGN